MISRSFLAAFVACLAVLSGCFVVAEFSDDSDAAVTATGSGTSSDPYTAYSTDGGNFPSNGSYFAVGASISIPAKHSEMSNWDITQISSGFGVSIDTLTESSVTWSNGLTGTFSKAGDFVLTYEGYIQDQSQGIFSITYHVVSSGSGTPEDSINYTTTAPVSGVSGSAYTYQVATNIPATFSKSGSWPSWLNMTSSGRVTGTCPTVSQATTYTAVIHAVSNSDSSNTADQTISVQVYPVATISASSTTVSGVTGQSVSLALSCNLSATFAVSSGSLPAGITLSSVGLISGTPSAVADGTHVTVRATTTSGPVQNPTIVLTFNIEQAEDTLAITSTAPSGSYHGGNAIQFVFAANVPGSTFELIGAPSWLAISGNKVVGSVPNTYETVTEVTWTLKATSPRGQTATQAASITCEKTIAFTTAPTAACVVIPLYDYNDDGSVDASVIDYLRERFTSDKVSAFRFVFVGEDAETVEWDFGDGSTSEGFSVTHKYTKAGTYTVTCTATNPVGSDECTVEVTVDADLSDYLFYGIIGAFGVFVIAIVAKICFGRRGSRGHPKRR